MKRGAGGSRREGSEAERGRSRSRSGATEHNGLRKKEKLLEMTRALTSDPVAIDVLRRAAVSRGGLLTDEMRRRVWPKLLSINVFNLPPKPGKAIRENHKDYNQVLMDVRRSLQRFPKGMREEQCQVLQEQLIDTILYILKGHPELHYYQGYHDIAVTLLLVVGERMGIAMLEKLSAHHLRDFMDPTMDSTKHILNYLMPILKRESPRLHDFMCRAEVGTVFALSWLITWYGHVLSNFQHILRLYDFFLASHPLMAIYFAAVIVLHREQEVLDCDCDMASVHHLLSRIPQDLPYETLISQADELFQHHPPYDLAKQAALQYRKSITITTFQDFQRATLDQRPDSILRQRLHNDSEAASVLPVMGNNGLVKMAVWGLSATLGAAALAVAQTALEWTPEFLFQLF
ncbi:TBC1 domain family member 20 isoform X2 [Microcaecilia unicolor]|uniref:TBC1 domain family member 20 n=1 Tax=Microcaecilia unicolor TaxID=1415580 RepID=A0A6P7ZUN8_9AMPH|nr:TBC1 domain family member 20-like isoform X2 [Microcaecilia unicolor]